MKITKCEQVQIGKVYMYKRFNNWSYKLEIGTCVGVKKDSIILERQNHSWNSTDEIKFVSERYQKTEYNIIAEYDKRIFEAYNKKIDEVQKELSSILEGDIKTKRRKSNKNKKKWYQKLWRLCDDQH